MKFRGFAILLLISALALCSTVNADEGMWLLNAPPRAALKDKYGFDVTDAWLQHVQKASVRFNEGGSGSFVSPDGLIITNHHVGADALQKLSDETHNYLRDGFYAKTGADEKKCVDMELNVLMSIEDVTARVNAAIPATATTEEAFAARRKITAEIENESREKTGFRSNVITLYQGAQYHLYRFKRYTDVRLVFAPEQQAAFYGGDPDNFEYPRYDLDICIFRAYENGKLAHPEQYLAWSANGSKDGDLIFVTGHPGRTERLLTIAELEDNRDRRVPKSLQFLKTFEVLLQSYSQRSLENGRRARDDLFGFQNSRKAYDGMLGGLLDPELMGKKRLQEAQLKGYAATHPEYVDTLKAWDDIAAAQKVIAANAMRATLLENYNMRSTLFHIARTLYRQSTEMAKPNGERLPEFRDSSKETLELELFSEEPIYDDYEQLKLTGFLNYIVQELGFNDPVVRTILAGKSPSARAAELVAGTKVKDIAYRKKLSAANAVALETESDPIIAVARSIDKEARAARKLQEEQTEIKEQAQAKIAKVRYALLGASIYPDATFTLRLSYGQIKGYEENGKQVPAFTNMAGLYERSAAQQNHPPFDLPPRWIERKAKLNLSTPFNFVSTADIIGGNSGSPTVNRAGEFVGIIFDENIQSLVLDYAYSDVQARALSVDSRAIIEALRKVYDAKALADELLGAKK